MFLDKLLSIIVDEGMNTPKAQVERYLSPILSIFLEDILSTYYQQKYQLITSEFPIRKGRLDPERPQLNQSTNIDYLMWNQSKDRLTFVELKTDSKSFKPSQLTIYQELESVCKTSSKPFGAVLQDDLVRIKKASSQSSKYKYLLEEKWQEHFNSLKDIEVLYLVPAKTNLKKKEPNLKVMYFEDFPSTVISFDEEYQIIRPYLLKLDQN